jgi:hypothetical protein
MPHFSSPSPVRHGRRSYTIEALDVLDGLVEGVYVYTFWDMLRSLIYMTRQLLIQAVGPLIIMMTRIRRTKTRYRTSFMLLMQGHYLTYVCHCSQRRRFDTGMFFHVVFLTSTALLPGALGVLFYYSLKLNVSDPHSRREGWTYVRPVFSKDNTLFGMRIKATAPLFLSSLSSSMVCVHNQFLYDAES